WYNNHRHHRFKLFPYTTLFRSTSPKAIRTGNQGAGFGIKGTVLPDGGVQKPLNQWENRRADLNLKCMRAPKKAFVVNLKQRTPWAPGQQHAVLQSNCTRTGILDFGLSSNVAHAAVGKLRKDLKAFAGSHQHLQMLRRSKNPHHR